MKAKIMIILLVTLSLSACDTLNRAGKNGYDFNAPQLKNARGNNAGDCSGSGSMNQKDGEVYLKYNGLPNDIQGNYACENGKPVLPKSCDGRRLGMQELRAYWEKYQLPVGYVWWDCHNGVPKVAPESIQGWHIYEQNNPTCKDTNGKKRPCI